MPPPSRLDPRYRTLDSWRGFACLIVVLHHAGFVLIPGDTLTGTGAAGAAARQFIVGLYRRGDLGVPLFFVISGYCIAASLDAHRWRGASSWRFLGRRIWRIYPPYWAAVACFAATVGLLRHAGWPPIFTGTHSLHLDGPGELTWMQWLGNLTLTETWRPRVLGGGPYRNLTRISWTLCFEEQFYLVGFALLLAFPRRLFGAMAVASLLILGSWAAACDAGWFHHLEGTFVERWHEFAVGLLVYWRLVLAASPRSRRVAEAILAGMAALGGLNASVVMVTVAAFGLALIALRPHDAALEGWRGLAPLRACGRRCYSIYLVHLPVCTVGTEALVQLGFDGFWTRALVVVPVVTLAGVGAGWIFYATVESRCHNPAPRAEPAPAPTDRPGGPILAPQLDPLGIA